MRNDYRECKHNQQYISCCKRHFLAKQCKEKRGPKRKLQNHLENLRDSDKMGKTKTEKRLERQLCDQKA
jgi:hypothetical protein